MALIKAGIARDCAFSFSGVVDCSVMVYRCGVIMDKGAKMQNTNFKQGGIDVEVQLSIVWLAQEREGFA